MAEEKIDKRKNNPGVPAKEQGEKGSPLTIFRKNKDIDLLGGKSGAKLFIAECFDDEVVRKKAAKLEQ